MRIVTRILGTVFATVALGTAIVPNAGAATAASAIAPVGYHSDCLYQNYESCTDGDDDGPIVRDHRHVDGEGGVTVRDHRHADSGAVVRDHRHPVIVRDHR
jgi:hypothetical protein